MNKKNILLHGLLNWHYSNNVNSFLPFQTNKNSIYNKDINITLTENSNLLNNSQNKKVVVKSHNLGSLKNEIENFDGCALKNTATNLVFSDGNRKAKVMVLGEAPGEEEDKLESHLKGKLENYWIKC